MKKLLFFTDLCSWRGLSLLAWPFAFWSLKKLLFFTDLLCSWRGLSFLAWPFAQELEKAPFFRDLLCSWRGLLILPFCVMCVLRCWRSLFLWSLKKLIFLGLECFDPNNITPSKDGIYRMAIQSLKNTRTPLKKVTPRAKGHAKKERPRQDFFFSL